MSVSIKLNYCMVFFFQFFQQFRHFECSIQIFELDPSNANKTLGELVMFICQVRSRFVDFSSDK